MLYLCHGNQLEDLADRLVLDLTRPVKDVLAPDLIAVPGQGIARWLSLRLAHQQGIIANPCGSSQLNYCGTYFVRFWETCRRPTRSVQMPWPGGF